MPLERLFVLWLEYVANDVVSQFSDGVMGLGGAGGDGGDVVVETNPGDVIPVMHRMELQWLGGSGTE